MSRSIKKAFVAPELIKRVDELNKTGEKKVSRPGAAAPRSSPPSSATPSRSMTAASTFPFMSRKIWSVTSSASLLPTRTFRGHAKKA